MTSLGMRKFRRDPGLTSRMYFTMFMLGILYAIFAIVMWSIVPSFLFVGVIVGGFALVQYFLSDRMILWASGAKLVTEQQEPELHRSIRRMADEPACRCRKSLSSTHMCQMPLRRDETLRTRWWL